MGCCNSGSTSPDLRADLFALALDAVVLELALVPAPVGPRELPVALADAVLPLPRVPPAERARVGSTPTLVVKMHVPLLPLCARFFDPSESP